MDEQVDKILIEPLDKKRAHGERPSPDEPPRESAMPTLPPPHTALDESTIEPHELPVWLL